MSSEALACIRSLTVNDEICKEIDRKGGIALITAVVAQQLSTALTATKRAAVSSAAACSALAPLAPIVPDIAAVLPAPDAPAPPESAKPALAQFYADSALRARVDTEVATAMQPTAGSAAVSFATLFAAGFPAQLGIVLRRAVQDGWSNPTVPVIR